MGDEGLEVARDVRVPRALLIALAGVVVALVALPLLAQPFVPPVASALAVTEKARVGGAGHPTLKAGAPQQGRGAASEDGEVVWISVAALAAERQVGARYADHGDTPETGFSCVGLVHWAYAQAGITVPESAPELAAAYPAVAGATPQGDALQPGDILLYHDTAWAGLSHASIYVGDGLMVSADSPETGVRLEPVGDAYWVAHWSGAVRVPGGQRAVRQWLPS